MKIEIWGTYPPPIGGVSIHIMRLVHRLKDNYLNVTVKDFNGTSKNKLDNVIKVKYKITEFLKLPFRENLIIHLHSCNFFALLCLYFFGKGKIVGATVHNKRLININSVVMKSLFSIFLGRLDFIILNDPSYREQFIRFFKLNWKKVHLCPAYIKPLEKERGPLPEQVLHFRNDKKFLISANAFMLKLEDGVDLYGLDLLIDLVDAMKKNKIDVGLIFCLPQVGNKSYYQKILDSIEERELGKDILILQKSISNAFQVWEISDVFVRPTTTDIEGVSVKEALDFGTRVIASDVCSRPEEAIIFKSRNFEDLYLKTSKLYTEVMNNENEVKHFSELDALPKILNVYKSFF